MRFRVGVLYVLFLSLAILLCACGRSEEQAEPKSFTAGFTAEYGEMTVKGNVQSSTQGACRIEITYPKTLSGLSFDYKGGALEMKREGLICSADEAYIPQNSFPSVVKKMLNKFVFTEENATLEDKDAKLSLKLHNIRAMS